MRSFSTNLHNLANIPYVFVSFRCFLLYQQCIYFDINSVHILDMRDIFVTFFRAQITSFFSVSIALFRFSDGEERKRKAKFNRNQKREAIKEEIFLMVITKVKVTCLVCERCQDRTRPGAMVYLFTLEKGPLNRIS